MAENEAGVRVKANTAEAHKAIDEFGDRFEEVMNALAEGSILDLAKSLLGLPAGLAAIVIGIDKLKEAVNEAVKSTAEITERSIRMGEELGITTLDALALSSALEGVGVSGGAYVSMAEHMERRIRANEEVMRAWGLATRDANGNLKPVNQLMQEAVGILSKYKEGTDRNIVAQQLFGRGGDEVLHMMELMPGATEASKNRLIELGVGTEESVQAFHHFQQAMAKGQEVTMGLKSAVSDVMMPVMTDFQNWLSDNGPAAIDVMRYALVGLMTAVLGAKVIIKSSFDAIKAATLSDSAFLSRAFEAINAAAHQDITSAKQAWKAAIEESNQEASKGWQDLVKDAEKYSLEIGDMLEHAFGKKHQPDEDDDTDKLRAPTSEQAVQKEMEKDKAIEALAVDHAQFMDKLQKLTAVQRDTELGKITQAEVDASEAIFEAQHAGLLKQIADVQKNKPLSAEKLAPMLAAVRALEQKHSEEEALIIINGNRRKLEAEAEFAKQESKARLDAIDADETAAKVRLDRGEITDLQFLAMQKQFDIARHTEAVRSITELLATEEKLGDVKKQAALHAQLLEENRKYHATLQKDDEKFAKEEDRLYSALAKSISSSFEAAFADIFKHGTTFEGWLKGLWQSLLNDFIKFVGEVIVQWAFGEESKTLATKLGNAARTLFETAGATSSAIVQKDAAEVSLVASEAKAIGGAVASIMSTYVYPYSLGVAGGAAGQLGAYYSGLETLTTAEGGYDIPAGINPMVQAHAREMILPAKHADVIRDMADNGGGGRSDIHLHVNAVDAQSVKRLFNDHGPALADALRRQFRNFSPVPQ